MNKVLTNLEITEDTDCCPEWPKMVHAFGYFTYEDYPEMATMFHVRNSDGNAWRVNFCPACGKPARMRNMAVSRIGETR